MRRVLGFRFLREDHDFPWCLLQIAVLCLVIAI